MAVYTVRYSYDGNRFKKSLETRDYFKANERFESIRDDYLWVELLCDRCQKYVCYNPLIKRKRGR